MKYLITFLMCLACFTMQAQQYTVAADTTTCRCTITNPGGEIKYMFLVDNLRYIDQGSGGNEIELFDDRMTFRGFNSVIVSHVSFAALKTDIDTWIAACR